MFYSVTLSNPTAERVPKGDTRVRYLLVLTVKVP